MYVPRVVESGRYLGESWAAFVNENGTEAQRRYLNFVNMSPKVMRGLRTEGARRAVTVTLLAPHAERIMEFPRGDKSALVNKTLCRGWLWPVLWKFTESLHEEVLQLREQVEEGRGEVIE